MTKLGIGAARRSCDPALAEERRPLAWSDSHVSNADAELSHCHRTMAEGNTMSVSKNLNSSETRANNKSKQRPVPGTLEFAERQLQRAERQRLKAEKAEAIAEAEWDKWNALDSQCEQAEAAGMRASDGAAANQPLAFNSCEVTPHKTKWSLIAWSPIEDESQSLGRFDSLKSAARYLKNLDRLAYCGNVITLTAPVDLSYEGMPVTVAEICPHYFESLAVYPGKWHIGHVDPETDEAVSIGVHCRRKDAVRAVRQAMREGLRPVLVAPWIDGPSPATLEELREAERRAAQGVANLKAKLAARAAATMDA